MSSSQFKDINEINYGHDDKFIFPFLRIDKIIFIEEISKIVCEFCKRNPPNNSNVNS